jgi:hypothetical protein
MGTRRVGTQRVARDFGRPGSRIRGRKRNCVAQRSGLNGGPVELVCAVDCTGHAVAFRTGRRYLNIVVPAGPQNVVDCCLLPDRRFDVTEMPWTTFWTDLEICDSLEEARAWIKDGLAKGWIYSHPKPGIYQVSPSGFVICATADIHVEQIITSIHLGTFRTVEAAREFVDREFRWHYIHPDPRHKNKPAASIKQFRGRFCVEGAPRPRRYQLGVLRSSRYPRTTGRDLR